MKAKGSRFWFAIFLTVATFSTIGVEAAQRELIKLTVGYTPISGATLPFYVALEARFFQKHGFEVSPVFMGGSPLINSAILAGEFPIGYTGGGAIISEPAGGQRPDCDCLPITGAHHRRLGEAGDQIRQ